MPVEFASAVDAAQCAVEVQRAMVERNAGATLEHRIEFRVGINVGDIIEDEGDIFEDGVNTAARLESIAVRGGICISQQMVDQIEGKLKFQFRELGRQNLKNISRPIEAYSVDLDEIGSPASRVLRAANLKQDIRHARPRRSQSADGFWPRNSGWYTWRSFRNPTGQKSYYH
jgi:class 3 adenylate cyclase